MSKISISQICDDGITIELSFQASQRDYENLLSAQEGVEKDRLTSELQELLALAIPGALQKAKQQFLQNLRESLIRILQEEGSSFDTPNVELRGATLAERPSDRRERT